MRIFVTGGTGLVGQRLVARLRDRGDEVLVLTRQQAPNLPAGCTSVVGDPSVAGPWLEQIDSCQAVVHLAGENVFARRWNKRIKQRIYDSRVLSTRIIAERIAKSPLAPGGAPRILISASAIGYYGPHDSEELDEESAPGNDFLATVCRDWENASEAARAAGARTTTLRIGVVLDARGGALAELVRSFRWYLGGPLGTGKQWVSWIHVADLVGLILFALDSPAVSGPLNATSPEPLTNWGFAKILGKVVSRPSWLTAPAWALRLALGEAAGFITRGQRVLPRRALKLGYSFKFPDLEQALRDILTGGNRARRTEGATPTELDKSETV